MSTRRSLARWPIAEGVLFALVLTLLLRDLFSYEAMTPSAQAWPLGQDVRQVPQPFNLALKSQVVRADDRTKRVVIRDRQRLLEALVGRFNEDPHERIWLSDPEVDVPHYRFFRVIGLPGKPRQRPPGSPAPAWLRKWKFSAQTAQRSCSPAAATSRARAPTRTLAGGYR